MPLCHPTFVGFRYIFYLSHSSGANAPAQWATICRPLTWAQSSARQRLAGRHTQPLTRLNYHFSTLIFNRAYTICRRWYQFRMSEHRNSEQNPLCHRRFQRGFGFISIMPGGFVRLPCRLTTRSGYSSCRPSGAQRDLISQNKIYA